ncbi:MAG: Crp/Fnr family transcriptional regulator [Akkermansiaceae bacterium]|nr:Crp/Fnr family transcriptional regulator [Armatimonadota bacterium]
MRTDLERALRKVLFLQGTSPATTDAFAYAGTIRRLNPDALLFCEGDPAPALLVVVSGSVKLFKWDKRGRELTLGIAKPGDVVGAPATFDGGNCPYHAAATGTNATVFRISREPFYMLLAAHPDISAGVIRSLAVQNRRLIEMLKAQALHTVRARFAAYLLSAAGTKESFVLPESNIGIAAHLGTVREVVSRTLHQFGDLGYISVRGRTVIITDRGMLMELATAPG